VLSCTSVWKPIDNTCWGDITQHQISTRLLSITPMLKLRTMKGCMAECLAQLAVCILPHVALPISLTVTLPAITIGGAIEAMKIWSECSRPIPSTAELVRRHPSWKQPLLQPKFPEDWRWETKA
jgi:hypothetical protein